MQLKGSVDLKADRERVFAFLTDPDRIGPCLPKVQSIKKLPDGRFEATARIGKGFLSATLVMVCAFTERTPPDRAAIHATGRTKGGSVDGTARMDLRDLPDGGTAVDWTADVTLSGLIARLAGDRVDARAQAMVDQTFKKVRKQLKAA